MNPAIGLLRTAAAAAAIGCDRKTLLRWAAEDATIARCIAKQTRRTTWWSVQRLRDAGLLTAPTAAPAQTISFSYDATPVQVVAAHFVSAENVRRRAKVQQRPSGPPSGR